MSDLLYYYCGGQRDRVQELAVSLYTLLKTNQNRNFKIGIALDQAASNLFDWRAAARQYEIEIQVLDPSPGLDSCGNQARHLINRWRGLCKFTYDRALILDIDTIVNKALGPLFGDIHPDIAYLTTFVNFGERVRRWPKHQRFYNFITTEYDRRPLYCAMGLHAISQGWPHIGQLMEYYKAMDVFKQKNRIRRVFIEEYSTNLVLLQNGRKVHFPRAAIRKASAILEANSDLTFVWHFIRGRSHGNPSWQNVLREVEAKDFLGISTASDGA